MSRGALLLAMILTTIVPSTGSAAASTGVAVDLGAIRLDQTLTPGVTYDLPELGVRNPGDEPSSYRMVVRPVAGRPHVPDPGWFGFSDLAFVLEPGATIDVRIELRLPPDAPDGPYVALVGAEAIRNRAGPQVGAVAAARVTFTVEASGAWGSWIGTLADWIGRLAPWSLVSPVVIILAVGLGWVRRRYAIAIVRR